jgi:DNA-binding GntR family transcriptional regulator
MSYNAQGHEYMRRGAQAVSYRRVSNNGQSVVDVAVAEIRQRIRNGDLVPGQRLVAGELSAELKISGGPVREALTRLAGEGLVELHPHRGGVVRSQTKEDVLEIFQLREVIEGLAARLAARAVAMKAASPAPLQAVADKGRRLAKAADFLRYAQANQEFHEAIYALAAKPRIVELASQLSDQIDRLNNRRLGHVSVLHNSAAEHDEIVAAIMAGNEVLAEERMRNHVSASGKTLVGDDI